VKLPGGLQRHHPVASTIIVHADGLPQPQRNRAILTIAIGLVMAVMDGAIANVALPTIAKDLNASAAFSIWIVNGYQLAITISLLPLASLGEIIGYRRVNWSRRTGDNILRSPWRLTASSVFKPRRYRTAFRGCSRARWRAKLGLRAERLPFKQVA
jgi:hypothetical protein